MSFKAIREIMFSRKFTILQYSCVNCKCQVKLYVSLFVCLFFFQFLKIAIVFDFLRLRQHFFQSCHMHFQRFQKTKES